MISEPTNHIQYPDEHNRIYCRRLHKVITLDEKGAFWEKCTKCRLFSGDYQGMGVECMYPDVLGAATYSSNANKEFMRVSKLIDQGTLPKEP